MLDGVCIRTIRGTYAWYLVHLLTKSAEEALGFAHGMTFKNFGSIRWPCAWCTSLVRAWQPWGSAILSTRHFSTCFYDWLVSKSSLTEPVQPSPDRHKAALFSRFAFPSTRLAAPPCAGLHQRDASLQLPCVAPAKPSSEFRIELHHKHSPVGALLKMNLCRKCASFLL